MIYVIDASAMIAYLNGEKGAELVERLLDDPSIHCHAHAVSFVEVYYRFRIDRGLTEVEADKIVEDLMNAGISRSENLDRSFCLKVGNFKSDYKYPQRDNRLPLGDCFVAALAQHYKAKVVTCDHNDFDFLHQNKVLEVLFLN